MESGVGGREVGAGGELYENNEGGRNRLDPLSPSPRRSKCRIWKKRG